MRSLSEKCAGHYLGAFAYRFNRRFHLSTLHTRLIVAAANCGPYTQRGIRMAEVHCSSGNLMGAPAFGLRHLLFLPPTFGIRRRDQQVRSAACVGCR